MRSGGFVGGQIVEDDDIAALQCRSQLCFDVFVEDDTIHRAFDHLRRVQPVMAQGGNKCLGVPVTERNVIDQALATWRPASCLDHVCL